MNKKEREKWQKEIETLCWNRFCETGAIGDYMLYHSIKKEEDEPRRKNRKGNSFKSNKLSGK